MDSLLTDSLKQTTEPLHHQLDHSQIMSRLMAPDLTQGQYVNVLQRMQHCFRTVEQALLRTTSTHFFSDWHYAEKSSALSEDLQYFKQLGGLPPSPAIPDLPLHYQNESEALGGMYVLFGSCLGAQFISKRVAQSLKLDRQTGLAFYQSNRDELSEWKQFKEKLNIRYSGQDVSEVLNGAEKTFEFFLNALSD